MNRRNVLKAAALAPVAALLPEPVAALLPEPVAIAQPRWTITANVVDMQRGIIQVDIALNLPVRMS